MALTVLSSVLALLADLVRATGHMLAAPSGVTALAATVLAAAVLAGTLAVCLATAARTGRLSGAVPLIGRAAALRQKSWGAAYTQQRDPDAAGRPRPRAPSAALAAATS
jgi:hypothetical protein